MKRLVLTACLPAVIAVGCVEIEPEEPTDEDGEAIEAPEPGEPWLEIESIEPSDERLAPDSAVVVYFSDYVDDDTFRSYAFANLTAGGLRTTGSADYRMVDRAVVWDPRGGLEEGFTYDFSIEAELQSASGSPFLGLDSTPRFVIDEEADATSIPELPDASWSQVESIFDESCASCHADESRGLNPLTYDALVGRPSEQVDRALVVPGDPADSYLMHKLLDDYPDIRFTHQPPPWDEDSDRLSDEQLRVIEGWIRRGAQR
ncbi:MAG: c-type cytochrome [Persicimonas sp.]